MRTTPEHSLKVIQSNPFLAPEFAEMSPQDREACMREIAQVLAPDFTPTGRVLDWELNYFIAHK